MIMIAGKKQNNYDCTSCKGEMHQCLLHNESVTLQSPDIPGVALTVNLENYVQLYPTWFKAVGHSLTPEWVIFSCTDFCPIPIFTPFSITALQLYQATGGIGKFSSPSEFLAESAIYVEAMETIAGAIAECSEYLSERPRREHGLQQP